MYDIQFTVSDNVYRLNIIKLDIPSELDALTLFMQPCKRVAVSCDKCKEYLLDRLQNIFKLGTYECTLTQYFHIHNQNDLLYILCRMNYCKNNNKEIFIVFMDMMHMTDPPSCFTDINIQITESDSYVPQIKLHIDCDRCVIYFKRLIMNTELPIIKKFLEADEDFHCHNTKTFAIMIKNNRYI